MKLLQITFIALLLTLFSCEDKVNVDLPEGEEKLVVDGIFTNDSSSVITLTKTAPYFKTGETPRVLNARVYITSNTNDTIVLEESIAEPGNYVANQGGEIGKSYILHITLSDGERYESMPEKMKRVGPIDRIYYEIDEDDDFDDDEDTEGEQYTVFIETQEIEGVGDYYRWIYYVDGELQNGPDDLFYVSDELADGSYISENDIAEGVTIGNHVLVKQLSITERAYNFWSILDQQIDVGGIFDSPPAPIKGNVLNKNSKKSNALGYFGVSAVESAEITIL